MITLSDYLYSGDTVLRILQKYIEDLRSEAKETHNEIDLVIFLRDPLTPKSHEPDVNSVVRLCDTHNIPLATNLATAELLIKSLDRGDLEWREMYK